MRIGRDLASSGIPGALALVVAQVVLLAQMGPYPPGSDPNGRYPQGSPGGIPFPWPRRSKKSGTNTKTEPASEKLVRAQGKLRKIDDKSLVLAASDGRVIEYRRTARTKFFGNSKDGDSKEIEAPKLKAGDEVSVEAEEDQEGYLSARNVYLEKSAPEAVEAGTGSSEAPPPVTTGDPTLTRDAPAPAPADPEDPGPPTLHHGPQTTRQTTARTPGLVRESPAAPPPTAASPHEAPASAPPVPAADAFLERARMAASAFEQKLPNYLCNEYMARFASTTRPVDWRPLDVVSTEVLYQNGAEHYRNVAINGKPVHKDIEQIGGSWSTGEFGTVLLDLFSRSTSADFRYRGESSASGTRVRVYDFVVPSSGSHWHVQMASQSINPAYRGSVWIEPASGRVLRIEMQARSLPSEFPMDTVESAVDYQYVRIGGGEFLLPVHAESLSCQRGSSNCSRNTIDFRNYHKYEAESNVTFGSAN
jgi:hypothetical protein